MIFLPLYVCAFQAGSAERLSHCVSVLSSPLNSAEMKRAALVELDELLDIHELWQSELNFRLVNGRMQRTIASSRTFVVDFSEVFTDFSSK